MTKEEIAIDKLLEAAIDAEMTPKQSKDEQSKGHYARHPGHKIRPGYALFDEQSQSQGTSPKEETDTQKEGRVNVSIQADKRKRNIPVQDARERQRNHLRANRRL